MCVILSEEFASPSEANPQSKDPYLTNSLGQRGKLCSIR